MSFLRSCCKQNYIHAALTKKILVRKCLSETDHFAGFAFRKVR